MSGLPTRGGGVIAEKVRAAGRLGAAGIFLCACICFNLYMHFVMVGFLHRQTTNGHTWLDPRPKQEAAAAVDDSKNGFDMVTFVHEDDITVLIKYGGAEGGGPIVESIVVRYVIANACEVFFPDAWPGSSVCNTDRSLDMSDDGHWRRNEATEYADGALTPLIWLVVAFPGASASPSRCASAPEARTSQIIQ